MKSIKVMLLMTENVKKFVSVVSNYAYDIDLRSGRFVVDAKSILGIFSLDLSTPILVEIYNDNCDDLINELSDFIVK